jgi:hypothetical protein
LTQSKASKLANIGLKEKKSKKQSFNRIIIKTKPFTGLINLEKVG